MTDKETFIRAYIEAAIFADSPESAPPGSEFDLESIADMRDTASNFYDAHTNDIESYCEGLEQAGHDLWYTHQHHGCGYWENDDEVSKRLDKAAKLLPERYVDLSDDGQLYIN